jgi:hypothetical protein
LKGIEKKLIHITLQYTIYHLNPLQSEITQTSPQFVGHKQPLATPRHSPSGADPTQPRLRGTTPSQARPTCPPLRCRRPSLSLPRAAASGRAVHAPTARRVWPHHTEPSKTGDAFPFQAGELPPPAMVYNGDTTAPHTCVRAHHKLSQTQHTITLTHSHTHTHTPRHR